MSTAELDCGALNTTECILRAAVDILDVMKQSSNGYNWDPPTFATTLIIGIVAIFFAALTIGQALIAAGQGRHKCSRYALGPWAQLSQRRLDWSELRFQSVAYTPVMSVRRLLSASWPDQEGWEACKDELDPSTLPSYRGYDSGKQLSRLVYKPKDLNEYFPATWLALLASAGLDHPGLWDLKPTGTDYIPSDLAAAPAYASTRDIITLFALASLPHRVQILLTEDSKVVSVRSRHFDLDFRQHPVLGAYGVFQAFTALERHRWCDWKSRGSKLDKVHPLVSRVLLLANGYMPQHEAIGNEVTAGLQHITYSLGGIQYSSRRHGKMGSRLQALLQQCKCSQDNGQHGCCGRDRAYWPSWCILKGDIDDLGALALLDVDDGGLELLAAEAPHSIPTLYPNRTMGTGEKIRALVSLSRLWSLWEHPWWHGHGPPNGLLSGRQSMLLLPDEKRACGQVNDCFRAERVPFNMCHIYARGKGWRAPASELDIKELPSGLNLAMTELASIDRWLKAHVAQNLLLCRWLSLSHAAVAQIYLLSHARYGQEHRFPWNSDAASGKAEENPSLPIRFRSAELGSRINETIDRISRFRSWNEENSEDGAVLTFLLGGYNNKSLPKNAILPRVAEELYKFLKLWEVGPGGDSFKVPTEEVQHPLDDLLIYRALLVALLLNAAADNSDILENEAHQKIIPIL